MDTDRFKFRAWDNEKGKYEYEIEHIWENGENVPDIESCYCFGDVIDHADKFVVEQCTGLTDRHGKLIYENDVVKTKDFGKDIDNHININDYDTFVVKFHECGFYIENDSRRFPMSCRPKLEIIGNIHEMAK